MLIHTTGYVSFLASAAEGYVKCFSNRLGTLFSTVSYTWASPPPINNFAHVYSDSLITDTLNWVPISGSFIADSAYSYIILGSFFDNSNTTISCTNSGSYDSISYYFIDNVCVSTDSMECDIMSGVIKNNPKKNIQIFPNPTMGIFTLILEKQELKNITIFNYLGKEILRQTVIGGKQKIDISDQPACIYFISIADKYNNQTHRIIKVTNP